MRALGRRIGVDLLLKAFEVYPCPRPTVIVLVDLFWQSVALYHCNELLKLIWTACDAACLFSNLRSDAVQVLVCMKHEDALQTDLYPSISHKLCILRLCSRYLAILWEVCWALGLGWRLSLKHSSGLDLMGPKILGWFQDPLGVPLCVTVWKWSSVTAWIYWWQSTTNCKIGKMEKMCNMLQVA